MSWQSSKRNIDSPSVLMDSSSITSISWDTIDQLYKTIFPTSSLTPSSPNDLRTYYLLAWSELATMWFSCGGADTEVFPLPCYPTPAPRPLARGCCCYRSPEGEGAGVLGSKGVEGNIIYRRYLMKYIWTVYEYLKVIYSSIFDCAQWWFSNLTT